jgi:hypothetical protein
MLPIVTRGLGPVSSLVTSGLGPPPITTTTRKKFGGSSRAKRKFTHLDLDKNKKYEPGKAPYDVFTVSAILLSVNSKKIVNNDKLSTITKTIYDEDIDIQVIDVRNYSSNPFYKIFIEWKGLKKRD